MSMFWRIALAGFGGYALGVTLGILLINAMSSNNHDRSTEAAMTSIFVLGPLAAVIAAVAAWLVWRH